MSRARRREEQGSFYESFSDLIFLTLIVFVVLVLALVLRLRLTRDAVAAQSDAGERQVADLAQDNARLRAQTQELAARISASDEQAALARQEAARLAQEVASLRGEAAQAASMAAAQPRPAVDRRPMSIAGSFVLPHPDTPKGRAMGFRMHATVGALGTVFRESGFRMSVGDGLGEAALRTPILGEQIEAFLAMLAYDRDLPQAAPMRLQFFGNFLPTRNGIDYDLDYWFDGSLANSLLLAEHPVHFAWGVARRDYDRHAASQRGSGWSHHANIFRSYVAGVIRISEIFDPKTGEPPERAIRLRVDHLTADATVFAGRELPLTVLSILLACNTGRPVLLPPEVEAALERLRR